MALSTVAGIAIAGLCLVFVVGAITAHWSDVRDELAHAALGWLLVALVAATGAMVWIAWCWSHALALVGHDAAGRPDRRRTFA
ncbi:MAG: hypothetical protein ACRDY6_15380, partial [Acidimicrobiia bacterium]